MEGTLKNTDVNKFHKSIAARIAKELKVEVR